MTEVRVETPFERRMREEREQRGEGEPMKVGDEIGKEKSQEKIQEEQEAVRVKYEEQYRKALEDEKRIVEQTAALIDQKS